MEALLSHDLIGSESNEITVKYVCYNILLGCGQRWSRGSHCSPSGYVPVRFVTAIQFEQILNEGVESEKINSR